MRAPRPLVGAVLAAVSAIPWIPARPKAPPEPRLAPPCRAEDLRAGLFLQGATGSLAGGVRLRNVGRTPCSLLGRPAARFTSTETPWRVIPAPRPRADLSAIYDPPSSLRALAPGRAADVQLFWTNWCPPGTLETSIGPPPDALVLVLPRGAGELRVRVRDAPRCDAPQAPSTIRVTPFVRLGRYLPPSSHLPLRASIVGVPRRESKRMPPALRARRGGLLHFSVALTNVSRRAFRFKSCPIYVEQLAGTRELYVLNCRPMPLLRPGVRAVFAMVLRVPRAARVGTNGLFWELAPRTYLPPTVGARVAVG